MRAPGRTPEAVLTRTTSRRAAIAAGAALLLVTSASANPSTAEPATATPATAAVSPATFTFALPATALAERTEHAASRAARTPHVRHLIRARPHPAARKTRVEHRAIYHRRATARTAPAPAGRLGAVWSFAAAQIGDPYVWGASGPGGWDCSGLTAAAYARIGVRLPHRAAEQAGRGVAIPRSQARVGDLVVWGSHHVGLYAGHGRVLHAPRPGKSVQVAPIWGSPTFRRVTRA